MKQPTAQTLFSRLPVGRNPNKRGADTAQEYKRLVTKTKGKENELDPEGKLRYRRTEEDIVRGG